MATMVTIKQHRFAGRLRAVGDEYEATGQAKRLAEALGWSQVALPREKEAPVRASYGYLTREMEPEAPVSEPAKKRTYRRRDQVAEPPVDPVSE